MFYWIDRNQIVAWRPDRQQRYVHSDEEENKVEIINLPRNQHRIVTYNYGNDLQQDVAVERNSSQLIIRRSGWSFKFYSHLVTEHARQDSEEVKYNIGIQENVGINNNIEEIDDLQSLRFPLNDRILNFSMFAINENDRLVNNQEDVIEGTYRMNFGFQTLSDSNMRRNNSTIE